MGCESREIASSPMRQDLQNSTRDRRSLRTLGKRLIGLLIAIGLAAGVAALSWPQLATARQTGSNAVMGELVGGRHIGQTFQAPFSGLYRVDVLLATYARQNEGRVVFHLQDGVEGSELATVEIDAAQVHDNAPHRFTFEPVADSYNRVFYFYLDAPEATPGNAIAVWETDFDSYPNGRAHIDDQPTDGDLRFTAYYRSSPREAWAALTTRVRTWHPLLWQMRWPVLGVAAAWVLGIGILLGELLVAKPGNE
jgi:hypothetical protein